ncbi:glycine betaine uptake BCCT transporter [Brevibacillus brevis]|uniref:glycine betaine uptake BCCT transporter n=1 Tax=Brevibacillus brevis TaxID=1393 RepID=UPI000D10B209|nr:BCCT family transporter [Brevibacillus brevis]PSJ67657.1 glycine/betaine ABC transporter permease [Brevibacillus brevis]RED28212.1 glycine betaine transporter [Brevibacillus brevis]GEC90498.1 glycine betaine transporter OpuD [Brevibacillus brevis]VEF90908.1 Glycine betaine transporter BetP [Brevibacillus brevis]
MTFLISLTIVFVIVLFGVISPELFASAASHVLKVTTTNFGWFYLIVTFGFLIFCIFLAFSRYGQIPLGSDDDEPEYSLPTWFAMLFSAGMGIGLVFWGVAEPVSHYFSPPAGVTGQTTEAAQTALRYAFFHWGLHPWGIYALIALALAYFQFRKGAKGLISSTFGPLLGERIHGPLGKGIDVLAVIATAFGVATSLGLGTLQINGGLSHLFGLPSSTTVQIVIISIITVLFLLSATTGLDRGIKYLSNTNLVLALLLLLLTLVLGPTSFIFDAFTSTLGSYLNNLISMSLRLTPFTQGTWVANWTLFYWSWWIAWAPFVGMFIARVSKGRTIKEFVICVMLVPSLLSFIWFSVFGGTALHLEIFDQAPIGAAVQRDISTALFLALEQLPMGYILAVVAILLIITFFITSADSAIFVLGMLSSDGNLDPSNRVKITWGVLQSAIAIVLLLSGGLEGLQTASIVAALPFTVIMVLMCFSLVMALQEEDRIAKKKRKDQQKKLERLLKEL